MIPTLIALSLTAQLHSSLHTGVGREDGASVSVSLLPLRHLELELGGGLGLTADETWRTGYARVGPRLSLLDRRGEDGRGQTLEASAVIGARATTTTEAKVVLGGLFQGWLATPPVVRDEYGANGFASLTWTGWFRRDAGVNAQLGTGATWYLARVSPDVRLALGMSF